LILCPSAVLGVWRREFLKHAPGEFDVVVLDGKRNSKLKAEQAAHAIKVQQSNMRPLVIVVNYETFWRPEVLKVLMSVTWEKVICDESQKIKSHSSTCSKEAWKVGKRSGSRTCLTGTPLDNDPADIFGQYRFLDDRIFGRFWTHYRNRYAILNQWIPQKVDKWVNLEELNAKFNSIRYHIGPEVLVLPEKQEITVEVPLSASGMKVYQQMKKESMAEVKRTMDEGGVDVKTAVACNGAVQFLRLLQLAQGYIRDDEGEEINTDTEKRKVLLELIEQACEPVCVFGWFKHDMAIIRECAQILGLRYGEISGDRKDLTPHAEMPDDIDVMGVQCKSGGAGIDLTRARIGIIMNTGMLTPGGEDQMLARQYRPGQTRNVVFYRLVSPKTVETKLYDDRGKKRQVNDAVMCELLNEEEEFF
jgi:SNF2 family DNA or RNA helicase